ncbi:MAG TPA: MGMT family protein [bacterium]|nr:MGMT family protein [bacterium]
MSSSGAGKAKKNKALQSFNDKVLKIVRRIPRGKLLTYGQVAAMAGSPRAARIVGGILFRLGPGSRMPWQRVVNSQGGISTFRIGSGERQVALLRGEGIRFNRAGRINLKLYQWVPSPRILKQFEVKDELAILLNFRPEF